MVSFNANLADPPKVSSNDIGGTAKGWVGYVLVAGLAFVALGLASNVVAPMIGNLLPMTSGEETSFQFGTNGGGL